MIHRHLDYEPGTPVEDLGPAALDDLLDRGDLHDWAPLARAVAVDPHGELADTVLHLCDVHPMYGTSVLWRTWIEAKRARGASRAGGLAELRRKRRLTQRQIAEVLGIAQSDVSKLERRRDLRHSTLRSFIRATGGELHLVARYPDGETLDLTLGDEPNEAAPA